MDLKQVNLHQIPEYPIGLPNPIKPKHLSDDTLKIRYLEKYNSFTTVVSGLITLYTTSEQEYKIILQAYSSGDIDEAIPRVGMLGKALIQKMKELPSELAEEAFYRIKSGLSNLGTNLNTLNSDIVELSKGVVTEAIAKTSYMEMKEKISELETKLEKSEEFRNNFHDRLYKLAKENKELELELKKIDEKLPKTEEIKEISTEIIQKMFEGNPKYSERASETKEDIAEKEETILDVESISYSTSENTSEKALNWKVLLPIGLSVVVILLMIGGKK